MLQMRTPCPMHSPQVEEAFSCSSFSTVTSPEVLHEEDLRAESLQKLLLRVCGEERVVRDKEKLEHICQETQAKRIYVKRFIFFSWQL